MLVVHCTSRVMLSLPVTVSQKMGLMGGSIWARGPERLARGDISGSHVNSGGKRSGGVSCDAT